MSIHEKGDGRFGQGGYELEDKSKCVNDPVNKPKASPCDELKPCPHCGKKENLEIVKARGGYDYVFCKCFDDRNDFYWNRRITMTKEEKKEYTHVASPGEYNELSDTVNIDKNIFTFIEIENGCIKVRYEDCVKYANERVKQEKIELLIGLRQLLWGSVDVIGDINKKLEELK